MFDNVHVDGVQTYATNHIGGLIGYGSYTTIRNSSVKNEITNNKDEEIWSDECIIEEGVFNE